MPQFRKFWRRAKASRFRMMLTHMTMKFDGVAESSTEYDVEIDYDYEHRFAEHEHESKTEDTPEPYG
jgi:hypothetical protein